MSAPVAPLPTLHALARHLPPGTLQALRDHFAARIASGDLVAVVASLSCGGPRCTVLEPSGVVVHGFRVADDYRPFDHEVVHRGLPVRARWVDAKFGEPTEDWHGNQIIGPKAGGGTEFVRADSYRLEVHPTEPPELR